VSTNTLECSPSAGIHSFISLLSYYPPLRLVGMYNNRISISDQREQIRHKASREKYQQAERGPHQEKL